VQAAKLPNLFYLFFVCSRRLENCRIYIGPTRSLLAEKLGRNSWGGESLCENFAAHIPNALSKKHCNIFTAQIRNTLNTVKKNTVKKNTLNA
jgi:hypothetical protein